MTRVFNNYNCHVQSGTLEIHVEQHVLAAICINSKYVSCSQLYSDVHCLSVLPDPFQWFIRQFPGGTLIQGYSWNSKREGLGVQPDVRAL